MQVHSPLGSGSQNIEFQSSYTLEPREKATTSKVIDGLIASGAVKLPAPGTIFTADDLVEINGNVSITAASTVGKMIYLFRALIQAEGTSILELDDLTFDSPQVQAEFKDLYLRNELPAIPILLGITDPLYDGTLYASIDPGRLVGSAAQDRLEGSHRILGSVRNVIPDSDDGYLSTDPWLLAGWEHLLRRTIMTQVGDQIKPLAHSLGISFPENDAYGWLKGPALIVDAIAIY